MYCVFLLREFDLLLMCILYLHIGSEFEEKVSNIPYAYEEKEEKLSVSHGVVCCVSVRGWRSWRKKMLC